MTTLMPPSLSSLSAAELFQTYRHRLKLCDEWMENTQPQIVRRSQAVLEALKDKAYRGGVSGRVVFLIHHLVTSDHVLGAAIEKELGNNLFSQIFQCAKPASPGGSQETFSQDPAAIVSSPNVVAHEASDDKGCVTPSSSTSDINKNASMSSRDKRMSSDVLVMHAASCSSGIAMAASNQPRSSCSTPSLSHSGIDTPGAPMEATLDGSNSRQNSGSGGGNGNGSDGGAGGGLFAPHLRKYLITPKAPSVLFSLSRIANTLAGLREQKAMVMGDRKDKLLSDIAALRLLRGSQNNINVINAVGNGHSMHQLFDVLRGLDADGKINNLTAVALQDWGVPDRIAPLLTQAAAETGMAVEVEVHCRDGPEDTKLPLGLNTFMALGLATQELIKDLYIDMIITPQKVAEERPHRASNNHNVTPPHQPHLGLPSKAPTSPSAAGGGALSKAPSLNSQQLNSGSVPSASSPLATGLGDAHSRGLLPGNEAGGAAVCMTSRSVSLTTTATAVISAMVNGGGEGVSMSPSLASSGRAIHNALQSASPLSLSLATAMTQGDEATGDSASQGFGFGSASPKKGAPSPSPSPSPSPTSSSTVAVAVAAAVADSPFACPGGILLSALNRKSSRPLSLTLDPDPNGLDFQDFIEALHRRMPLAYGWMYACSLVPTESEWEGALGAAAGRMSGFYRPSSPALDDIGKSVIFFPRRDCGQSPGIRLDRLQEVAGKLRASGSAESLAGGLAGCKPPASHLMKRKTEGDEKRVVVQRTDGSSEMCRACDGSGHGNVILPATASGVKRAKVEAEERHRASSSSSSVPSSPQEEGTVCLPSVAKVDGDSAVTATPAIIIKEAESTSGGDRHPRGRLNLNPNDSSQQPSHCPRSSQSSEASQSPQDQQPPVHFPRKVSELKDALGQFGCVHVPLASLCDDFLGDMLSLTATLHPTATAGAPPSREGSVDGSGGGDGSSHHPAISTTDKAQPGTRFPRLSLPPGIFFPYLIGSMAFTNTSWHVEDFLLQSINLLLVGRPKIWWWVPRSAEGYFSAYLAREHEARRVYTKAVPLAEVPLKELIRHGVRRVVQPPGVTLVTSPGYAFHTTLSCGWSLADSSNFMINLKGLNMYSLDAIRPKEQYADAPGGGVGSWISSRLRCYRQLYQLHAKRLLRLPPSASSHGAGAEKANGTGKGGKAQGEAAAAAAAVPALKEMEVVVEVSASVAALLNTYGVIALLDDGDDDLDDGEEADEEGEGGKPTDAGSCCGKVAKKNAAPRSSRPPVKNPALSTGVGVGRTMTRATEAAALAAAAAAAAASEPLPSSLSAVVAAAAASIKIPRGSASRSVISVDKRIAEVIEILD